MNSPDGSGGLEKRVRLTFSSKSETMGDAVSQARSGMQRIIEELFRVTEQGIKPSPADRAIMQALQLQSGRTMSYEFPPAVTVTVPTFALERLQKLLQDNNLGELTELPE